jgi:hypothetical protein
LLTLQQIGDVVCTPDNPQLIRLAFHQAGHIVAAISSGIAVESASVVTIEGVPPHVRLAPLHEVIAVAEAEEAKIDLVRRYVVARLAGPVAGMIHSANLFRALGHTVNWPRWRLRWKNKLERQEDADLDFAFATIFGWCRCRNVKELHERLAAWWKETEGLLRRTDHWRQVECLAAALIERDVLTGAEAIDILRSLAP